MWFSRLFPTAALALGPAASASHMLAFFLPMLLASVNHPDFIAHDAGASRNLDSELPLGIPPPGLFSALDRFHCRQAVCKVSTKTLFQVVDKMQISIRGMALRGCQRESIQLERGGGLASLGVHNPQGVYLYFCLSDYNHFDHEHLATALRTTYSKHAYNIHKAVFQTWTPGVYYSSQRLGSRHKGRDGCCNLKRMFLLWRNKEENNLS